MTCTQKPIATFNIFSYRNEPIGKQKKKEFHYRIMIENDVINRNDAMNMFLIIHWNHKILFTALRRIFEFRLLHICWWNFRSPFLPFAHYASFSSSENTQQNVWSEKNKNWRRRRAEKIWKELRKFCDFILRSFIIALFSVYWFKWFKFNDDMSSRSNNGSNSNHYVYKESDVKRA